ncbi:hypothetical protein G6L08_16475 [Agrobacterium rhizogenes]|nr:hypothetical protein [Rhizobium rhizogenes]
MTDRLRCGQTVDCCVALGIDPAEIWTVVARCWLADAFRREFVLRRALAWISEAETADRGEEQAPTEGGPDKRPQCAARLGGCFSWVFSPFRQCALFRSNVRVRFKVLFILRFVNIAGGGDGA